MIQERTLVGGAGALSTEGAGGERCTAAVGPLLARAELMACRNLGEAIAGAWFGGLMELAGREWEIGLRGE